jgi:hypothetical protein
VLPSPGGWQRTCSAYLLTVGRRATARRRVERSTRRRCSALLPIVSCRTDGRDASPNLTEGRWRGVDRAFAPTEETGDCGRLTGGLGIRKSVAMSALWASVFSSSTLSSSSCTWTRGGHQPPHPESGRTRAEQVHAAGGGEYPRGQQDLASREGKGHGVDRGRRSAHRHTSIRERAKTRSTLTGQGRRPIRGHLRDRYAGGPPVRRPAQEVRGITHRASLGRRDGSAALSHGGSRYGIDCTRHTVLPASSATRRKPSAVTASPTGRPCTSPVCAFAMKPVRKSSGGPAGVPSRKGTKTTR